MERVPQFVPHLMYNQPGKLRAFTPPSGGGTPRARNPDRARHVVAMRGQLDKAMTAARHMLAERDRALLMGSGIYLRFTTRDYEPTDYENYPYGIFVVSAINSEDDEGLIEVTVFVPENVQDYFTNRLNEYESGIENLRPPLADAIEAMERIEAADRLEALWTDRKADFPETDQRVWWEVWLIQYEQYNSDLKFDRAIRGYDRIEAEPRHSFFTDRTVRLVYATPGELREIAASTGSIAEIRAPRTWPSELLEELESTVVDPSPGLGSRVQLVSGTVAVALFDTGLSHKHPLLAGSIGPGALKAWNAAWGTGDSFGHGTMMGGLALFGDLHAARATTGPLRVAHRLESVKVVPDGHAVGPPATLYGLVYGFSIKDLENSGAAERRIICCAVNDADTLAGYQPTEWSAMIDLLTFEGKNRRLFVVSAGNIKNARTLRAAGYPADNHNEHILNPAQSWNALTIGGYTDLDEFDRSKYARHRALATRGGLSPQSRTAMRWEPRWPVKPDIVLEAGNFAHRAGDENAMFIEDMALLSTGHRPTVAPLVAFGYTSAATALGARLCATVASRLPDMRLETIRALVVNSAEWTPRMVGEIAKKPLAEKLEALRRYGYGVPSVDRAIRSTNSDLSIVIQGSIQPYIKLPSGSIVSNHMRVYELPWPKAILAELGDAPVRIKVTLSYFIQPNPGRRGWKDRYSYQSHGLRFALRRPGEPDFEGRVSAEARDEDFDPKESGADNWFLGVKARDRGCLIADQWEGRALEALDRDRVAVFPVGGWWKHRPNYAEQESRFAVVVSMKLLGAQAVDIYSYVAERLGQVVTVEGD